MGVFIFKSPTDPQVFEKFKEQCQFKVIRDNITIHRPFIKVHDGIQSLRNGCKVHVVMVHSVKGQDHDIVIMGSKWLDFHSLAINFKELMPFAITKQEEITKYLTFKPKQDEKDRS